MYNKGPKKPQAIKHPGQHLVTVTAIDKSPSKSGHAMLKVLMVDDQGQEIASWFTKTYTDKKTNQNVPNKMSMEQYAALQMACGVPTGSAPELMIGKRVGITAEVSFLKVSEYFVAPSAGNRGPTYPTGPIPPPPPMTQESDPWGAPPDVGQAGDDTIPF